MWNRYFRYFVDLCGGFEVVGRGRRSAGEKTVGYYEDLD
jgi:hypothetical protein